MKFKMKIKNWEKFKAVMLDRVIELEFMGETYKNKKDIKKYSREAFLVREEIKGILSKGVGSNV